MAKITTITNPLTGQPAQVDQLDHTAQEIDDAIARALPGGAIDITLQNKAPAGYGLGTGAVIPPNNNLDNAVHNGWYVCTPSFNGAPTGHDYIGYGTVLVIERASDSCTQVYWSESSANIPESPLNLVRKYNGTAWSPWEWVNPPMKLGVEYRTTERYNGKPVYVKLVDFGAGANNTEKSVEHGASNAIVIDYGGYAKRANGTLSVPWITHSTLSVSDTVIVMTADANYSGYNVYVWIKYYRTTD